MVLTHVYKKTHHQLFVKTWQEGSFFCSIGQFLCFILEERTECTYFTPCANFSPETTSKITSDFNVILAIQITSSDFNPQLQFICVILAMQTAAIQITSDFDPGFQFTSSNTPSPTSTYEDIQRGQLSIICSVLWFPNTQSLISTYEEICGRWSGLVGQKGHWNKQTTKRKKSIHTSINPSIWIPPHTSLWPEGLPSIYEDLKTPIHC